MNIGQALELIKASGVGEHAEELADLLSPSVRLVPQPCSQDELEIGVSRFGGEPDLPARIEWPEFKGKPLGFLAQICFQELERFETSRCFPPKGGLVFFYQDNEMSDGLDPEQTNIGRVFYVSGDEKLTRRSPPEGIREREHHHPCRISLEKGWELPDQHEKLLPWNRDDEEKNAALAELKNRFSDNRPQHHLLGHAQSLHGDMRFQCQLVSNGINGAKNLSDEDPLRRKLEEGAEDWMLLLQLDCDNAGPKWSWIGNGRLYFWIKHDDLRGGDFEDVLPIRQSA